MGVHDVDATQECKKLLGIPEDEPIFILRAQDILYPAILGVYEQCFLAAVQGAQSSEISRASEMSGLTDEHWQFSDHVDACRSAGLRWQRKNPKKIKIPD
jgi:hypothetical protein